MKPHPSESASGDYVPYVDYSDSGTTVAGTTLPISSSDPISLTERIQNTLIIVKSVELPVKHGGSLSEDSTPAIVDLGTDSDEALDDLQWPSIAEQSFAFWDNDEDAIYDDL